MRYSKRHVKEVSEAFIEPSDTKLVAQVELVAGLNIYKVAVPKASMSSLLLAGTTDLSEVFEEKSQQSTTKTHDGFEIVHHSKPTDKNQPEKDANFVSTLVFLPPKFRKVVWVKRGNYVLVDLGLKRSDKVSGEIIQVLMQDNVKKLKSAGKWPTEFDDSILDETSTAPNSSKNLNADEASDEYDSEEESDDIWVNTNRRVVRHDDSDTDTDTDANSSSESEN